MEATLGTGEDLESLVKNEAPEEEAAPQGQPVQIVPIPAKIVLVGGTVLDCAEPQSWGYTPYGVFATGKVEGFDYDKSDKDEDDWLIPYNSILRVEFNYPAYFKLIEAEDETPSD